MDILSSQFKRTPSVPDKPNAFTVGLAMLWAMRVRNPDPSGQGVVDHGHYATALSALQRGGIPALAEQRGALKDYFAELSQIDPDTLSRDESLAYWLNLYNAGALDLALDAWHRGEPTVLRIPQEFSRRFIQVAGETLSLHDIEHGKVRRFKEPRIHGALNCGSVSCPKLQPIPYTGDGLDEQLEEQMRRFFTLGGIELDVAANLVWLSRIFLWFSGDFVRSQRMPSWFPAGKRDLLKAVQKWLDEDTVAWLEQASPKVEFQPYDWGLRCAVGSG
ncbi:MAG: DUF547 domain-containing protein [Trueperaceae bacterium]|nr:MAG: DUF547 domain-containing protein [Trueperaceae bacterium]